MTNTGRDVATQDLRESGDVFDLENHTQRDWLALLDWLRSVGYAVVVTPHDETFEQMIERLKRLGYHVVQQEGTKS